ncbi:MAG: hypothetical protein ACXWV7_06160 [Nitrospira sp.]
MTRARPNQPAKSGITHFPLEEEQDRQEQVHAKAAAQEKGSPAISRQGQSTRSGGKKPKPGK